MLEFADIGCWIVKGDPKVWDYFRATIEDTTEPIKPNLYPSGWTLGKTYRNTMMHEGDLVALWITGARKPGIYEFGYLTSDCAYTCDGFSRRYAIDTERASRTTWAVDYAGVRLGDHFVPRDEMKKVKELMSCEQFRQPMMSNPSYMTPDETKALASLIARRVTRSSMRSAHWAKLL